MQVLVTGATGFIGQALVPALLRDGHRVRAGARNGAVTIAGVEMHQHGDLRGQVDWASLCKGVDAVVHLAGIAHVTRTIPVDQYELVNHAATEELANAARRAGARRFVFVSSIRAQTGPIADHVLTERDEPRPTDAYGRSKLAAEASVRASGAPYTILRPVLVYGSHLKGNLAALSRLAALPLPLPFGAFVNRRSLLALSGLVSAVCHALSADSTVDETYVVADRTPLALRDIVGALRAANGRSRMMLPVPLSIMRPLLRLARSWDRVGGELVVDPSKLAATGWRPVEDTVAELQRIVRVQ